MILYIKCYISLRHDTKIMLNSVKSRAKQSKLEKAMNKEILVVFVLQFIICFVVAIIYATFYKTHQVTINN